MRISLFVHDLAANPIVRAAPLALAMERLGYEVEVLGLLISGPDIWKPYQGKLNYKALPLKGRLRNCVRQLANISTGQVIYACKPLLTSFGPALLASGFGLSKPLLLDVEDNEFWVERLTPGQSTLDILSYYHKLFRSLKHNFYIHPFTKICRRVTVVSSELQRRYGGTILLHGPDERQFDPCKSDLEQSICRKKHGLPEEIPLVLFAGTPHKHKGLQCLVSALCRSAAQDYHLVLVGRSSHPQFQEASLTLGNRCHILDVLPNEEMPEILAAVNVVPVPQLDNPFTKCQVPAKLLEAMAMEKAVIVSRVSDLGTIVGEGENEPRGWVVDAGRDEQIAERLAEILRNPDDVSRRARNARQFFLDTASTDAIGRRLRPILQSYAKP